MTVGLAEYEAYERVRKGGRWNMYDPRARQATGLTREEYREVMRRYSELRALAEQAPPGGRSADMRRLLGLWCLLVGHRGPEWRWWAYRFCHYCLRCGERCHILASGGLCQCEQTARQIAAMTEREAIPQDEGGTMLVNRLERLT